jgi:hypothetical protein
MRSAAEGFLIYKLWSTTFVFKDWTFLSVSYAQSPVKGKQLFLAKSLGGAAAGVMVHLQRPIDNNIPLRLLQLLEQNGPDQ